MGFAHPQQPLHACPPTRQYWRSDSVVQRRTVGAALTPGTGHQGRRKGLGAGRTGHRAPVERTEGGQEAPVTSKECGDTLSLAPASPLDARGLQRLKVVIAL